VRCRCIAKIVCSLLRQFKGRLGDIQPSASDGGQRAPGAPTIHRSARIRILRRRRLDHNIVAEARNHPLQSPAECPLVFPPSFPFSVFSFQSAANGQLTTDD
jgi:hypothetical protein